MFWISSWKRIYILTKEVGYIRQAASNLGILKLRYQKYPKVYELMANRHNAYNETLRFLEEEEAAGRAFVIRPKEANDIGRIEKDRAKLEALYELGYEDARNGYENMMQFLQKE